MEPFPRIPRVDSLLDDPAGLPADAHCRYEEDYNMQHEFVCHTMIDHETRQPKHDSPSVSLLLPFRLAEGEDLDHNASCGQVHGHLIAHLRMVFQGGMVNRRSNAHADEAEVWPVDGSERTKSMVAVAAYAMDAIKDCEL